MSFFVAVDGISGYLGLWISRDSEATGRLSDPRKSIC